MLWLITATNHDGSSRQWAEYIDTSDELGDAETIAEHRAFFDDPHTFNPGHKGNVIGPVYTAQPL